MFKNIPLELQALKSWCVWRFEDVGAMKPTKVPYCAHTNKLCSVSDPNTWSTFPEALAAEATGLYSGIGFIISDADPYCFIDLDQTDKSEFWENQQEISEYFNSYAEISPSGKGLHIIVRGGVPSGRKRNSIEVYSDLRYMTMTGNVYRNEPIRNYHNEIMSLWESLASKKRNEELYPGTEPEEFTDLEILEQAGRAVNGEKFIDLWKGNWQDYYQSQSEGDLALVDILAFYSKNKKQISRLFLQSELGQRDKAKRTGYIGYMTDKCFDNMLPPVDIEGLRNSINAIIEKKQKAEQKEKENLIYNTNTEEPSESSPDLKPTNEIYSVPGGLLGKIAEFIYEQAARPVPEIALAGAIGVMSGVAGRAYNISGHGLNQYTLLIGQTGCGKGAMRTGVNKLFASVKHKLPSASEFMGPGAIASQQAIVKYMSGGRTSIISMLGEFGHTMQALCQRGAPPHLVGIRQFLLLAYDFSGKGITMEPTIYSDKEKNTQAILSPAFSLLGETTPSIFYQGLHDGLISEGFLPRFTLIEYTGKRVPLNRKSHLVKPSYSLIEQFSNLCAYSLSLNNENKVIEVEMNKESKEAFASLENYCDMQINSTGEDIKHQLWNRVGLKSMKLAALVAVGINPINPVIDIESANWAINLITNDARNFIAKFDLGEIGIDNDENQQLLKVMDFIKKFVTSPFKEVKKYANGLSNLHSDKIVPYCYIQRNVASLSVFRKDRLGSTTALKRAISTLLERGDITEIGRSAMSRDYNTTTRAFMISNLKGFKL